MKQHITEEQLHELLPIQGVELAKWMDGTYGAETSWLMTVGQMIEYLERFVNITKPLKMFLEFDEDQGGNITGQWIVDYGDDDYENDELCDALWEAVKQVLSQV